MRSDFRSTPPHSTHTHTCRHEVSVGVVCPLGGPEFTIPMGGLANFRSPGEKTRDSGGVTFAVRGVSDVVYAPVNGNSSTGGWFGIRSIPGNRNHGF